MLKLPTTLKRVFLAFFAVLVISGIAFGCWLNTQYVVPILMYHHVGDPSEKPLILNDVSVAVFDEQMNFLKQNGYHVISTDELVEGIKNNKYFSRKTVVIQFDDGYENNYANAFPILRKYEFPAMVFLVADKIGSPGFVSWEQMKEMEKFNFKAGSHTRTHKYLPKASEFEQYEEIVASKRIIEENLGHPVDYFAYPTGGFTPYAKEVLKKAGYKAAMTTNRGFDKSNKDLYELKRIRVKETDRGFIFASKVSGFYNVFRSTKSGY